MTYSEYITIMKAAVQKYQSLPLKEFITKVLEETHHDLNLINNMYIDEVVDNYPGIGVCYKKNDEFVIYVVDDYGKRNECTYRDPYVFIRSFLSAARICGRPKS